MILKVNVHTRQHNKNITTISKLTGISKMRKCNLHRNFHEDIKEKH